MEVVSLYYLHTKNMNNIAGMHLTKIPQNIFNQAILRFSFHINSSLQMGQRRLKGPEPLDCNWCRHSRGQGDNDLWSLGGPRRIVRDSWDSQRQKGSQSIQDMAPNDPEQYSEGLPWPIFNSGAFDAKSYPVLVPWSCSLFITSHHCRLPV